MDQAGITASPKLRVIFVVVSTVMLALWGLSLIPPIKSWGDPNEDGFSYVPPFWATITCLPVGLYLLAGAIAGRGRHVARARTALFLGGGLLFLVVAFLIFQHIANSIDGS
jgi:ABC-type dipeptide/oligopeptide/nickel transport system permease subunit